MPVIGYLNWLSATGRPDLAEAFRQGLAVAGYVHGRNVVIESRYANNQIDQLRTLAAELIARQVDVIVATGGNNPGLVAKTTTSTIPILFTSGRRSREGGPRHQSQPPGSERDRCKLVRH